MDVARPSRRGILCFYAALVLTTWGLLTNTICFVPEIRLKMVASGVSFSVSALALLGIGWRHMEVSRRVVSVLIALVACLTIIGGGTRLPAMFGW